MLSKIPIKLRSSRPWMADFRDTATLPNLQASVVKRCVFMGSCLLIIFATMWAIYNKASIHGKKQAIVELESFLQQNKNMYQISVQKHQEFLTRKVLMEAIMFTQSFPLDPLQVLLEITEKKPAHIKYTFIAIENTKNLFRFIEDSKNVPPPTSSKGRSAPPPAAPVKEDKDAFSIRLEGLIKGSDHEALAIFDQYKSGLLQWECLKPFLTTVSLKADPIRLENSQNQMKFNAVFKNE